MKSRRAIVTGAAGGIGLAIAKALVEAGSEVLLADMNVERVNEIGFQLNRPVWAGDVSSEEGIADLLAVADRELGGVDMYVANAGVFRGFGLDAAEDDWDLSIQVNVMAHVRAARALVPRWSSENPGVFVVTASAAGLLTQLGSPTYSVSKHAAVGFAEWLAATYGDRGVQVCAICPMGVTTPMTEEGQHAEDPDVRLAHRAVATAGPMLSSEEVAAVFIDAINNERFLALPHPEVAEMWEKKAANPDHWVTGMQRYRTMLENKA